eukprot:TRINITY_DN12116_c0_g1_i1.p1 TRINITY_DN12116_c0_g1~~TRINITY_DN12116_c0_g1_i1.p1  ORF type:complete len:130 (-),score=29.24 TRINITY_DN12116_c0_g1_i1:116-505(-)
MKYLVCVDGSDNADKAFQRVKEIFQKTQDELYVMIAHSTGDAEKSEQELSILKNYAKICLDNGFNSKMVAAPIPPSGVGAAICEKITELQIDTVVCGRRGLNTIQRLFAGSVSRYVMENATCNVLIVKS